MPKVVSSKIHVELSADELQAIIKVAEDQLFRIKFIDPKMPGHTKDKEQLHAVESALSRLKQYLPKALQLRTPNPSNIHVSGTKAKAS